MRFTSSAWVPSLLWKVTFSSFCNHSSMPALATRRSFSQKNFASAKRAESTFWLPARIVAPLSAVVRLATVIKRSIRPVLGLRTEKNFWCSRIDVCSTSAGRPKKSSSIAPIRTTGHSTSPATSANNPASSTTSRPFAKAWLVASCQMASARSCGSRTTCADFSLVV